MNLLDFFKKAEKEGWAIGQFNFSTLEQLKGITEAALALRSPVILGTSESEASFLGMEEAVALSEVARKRGVSCFLHLDHGKSFEKVREAVEAGYHSVHVDGSSLSFSDNLKLTKKVVKYAQKRKIPVEGELGVIGGDSEVGSGKKKSSLTDPSKVRGFVEESGVTSLAVSIGNIHGIAKEEPEVDLALLEEIEKKVRVPLVFHGGSGCPAELLERVIGMGVRKVNINTVLRKTWKKAVEKGVKKDSVKPYVVLGEVGKRVTGKTGEYIRIFKSQNRA